MKVNEMIPAYELEAIQHAQAEATHDTLHQMNTCCLCGTKLKFLHVTNFTTMQVTERAQCPACGIKTKESQYGLQ